MFWVQAVRGAVLVVAWWGRCRGRLFTRRGRLATIMQTNPRREAAPWGDRPLPPLRGLFAHTRQLSPRARARVCGEHVLIRLLYFSMHGFRGCRVQDFPRLEYHVLKGDETEHNIMQLVPIARSIVVFWIYVCCTRNEPGYIVCTETAPSICYRCWLKK